MELLALFTIIILFYVFTHLRPLTDVKLASWPKKEEMIELEIISSLTIESKMQIKNLRKICGPMADFIK